MGGDEREVRIVLQPRDRRLLEELYTLRVVDRKQASAIAPFQSKTRANARLLALTRAGILKRTFIGTIDGGRRAVYCRADSPAFLNRRANSVRFAPAVGLLHQLEVNDVYVAALTADGNRISLWQTFSQPLASTVSLIPDAYFEIESALSPEAFFLEVDRGTEPLNVWRAKAKGYLNLATSGLFEREFGKNRFGVVVVAPSDRRLRGIQRTVAIETEKLFFFSINSAINEGGFWSAIWLRPIGDARETLLKKEQLP